MDCMVTILFCMGTVWCPKSFDTVVKCTATIHCSTFSTSGGMKCTVGILSKKLESTAARAWKCTLTVQCRSIDSIYCNCLFSCLAVQKNQKYSKGGIV